MSGGDEIAGSSGSSGASGKKGLTPQHLPASGSSAAGESRASHRADGGSSSDPPGRISGSSEASGSATGRENRHYRSIKVTCPPPGSNPSSRAQAHDEMMRLESRRRSEIATEMEMYQERWHVAKDILDLASDSVERAERLVNGFTKASEAFASQLRAISEDKFIDSNGEVVPTWKAQNRLSKQRDFSDAIDILSPITAAIVESQSTMAKEAEAMENSCNQISSHVLTELQELKSTIQGGARTLKIQGGAILAELKQADSDIKTVWDIFDGLASNDLVEQSTHGGSMHGTSMHGTSMHGTKVLNDFMDMIDKSAHGVSMHGGMAGSSIRGGDGFRRGNQGRKAMLKQMGGGKDYWLVAQFYNTATQNQVLAMAATKEKLDEVIDKVIALEEKRLSGLHRLLSAGFLQRKKNLFATFPMYSEVALKELEGASITENSLDEFLDNRSLKRLKHSQSHRSSIMNRRSVLSGVSESIESIPNSIEEFGDPFDDLSPILSSKVVELKRPGALYMMDAEWTVALVIVSKAGTFHVIEAPPGKGITTETSSAHAFQALRPNMDFSSSDSWKERSKVQLLETLTPAVSLDIAQCMFQHSTLQKREVQVLVTGEQKARNILFGTSATVKCTLRLKSPMVANAFTEALKKMRASILTPSKAKANPSKK